MLKKGVLVVAAALVMILLASIGALAQTQTFLTDVYWVSYYSNRNNSAAADQTVRIINPGETGTPLSSTQGTLCADIYVFNNTQEMIECCHCPVTADEVIELSVNSDLVGNPLTGNPPPNLGVLKIVSDSGCMETSPEPTADLRAWATHVQQPLAGTFVTTEDAFQAAPLDPGLTWANELGFLGEACSFVEYLGSGKGVCTCK